MRVVRLDAGAWRTELEFIAALKHALNAPHWCGDSPAAIDELMVWGLGPQVLQPPYEVEISGLEQAPKEVREYVALIVECVSAARQECKARDGKDIDVGFKIVG
ncbi:MAG: barstar family protein [Alphaproteobacteria bacterium]|nr:barstar family protein [Alphaproteobacteria bacterium]MBV8408292.1 barstar family protein [Alphaproteobacteria bacterium]